MVLKLGSNSIIEVVLDINLLSGYYGIILLFKWYIDRG